MAKRREVTGPKTALIYCRVSTRNQDGEDKTSLATQEAACRKHAEKLGYRVGKVTKETYTGAELWDRPLLARDRAAIMAGEYQALIVYALDRLSREQNALGLIACECLRGDCELISVTEDLDNSPTGKFLRSAAVFAAELEREKIRERTQRGRMARLQQGKPVFSGLRLYGYQPIKEEGRYEVVQSEAIIVRRIFQMCVEGRGCHSIALGLNNEGVPSPKPNLRPGVKWNASAVHSILRNQSYMGIEYQGRSKARKVKGQRYAQPEKLPREKWIRLPDGIRPAIVSAELWNSAQERLKSRAGVAARNQKNPVLLRGLIFCGDCGSRMLRNQFSRGRYQYEKYRCGSRDRSYRTECKGKPVDVRECNEWVWNQVKAVFTDPSIIEREVKRQQTENDPQLELDLAALRKKLNQVESGIQALLSRFRNNPALASAVEREAKAAAKEQQQLEAAIRRLEERIDAQNRAAVDMKSFKDYCKQVAGRLDRLPFDGRRLALEALGVRIEGNGLDWRLELKVPSSPKADVVVSNLPW